MAKRIVCTNQSDWLRVGHGHIVSVGIGDSSGWAEKEPVQTVIRNLKAGISSYYTEVNGKRAEVDVWSCDRCGHETIRSNADGYWNNNLDALQQCS